MRVKTTKDKVEIEVIQPNLSERRRIMINFKIYGMVKAKGRPRFRNAGKFVQAYTDKDTANYENLVRLSYVESGCEQYKDDVALECNIDIFIETPKSASKKQKGKMLSGLINPTKKPDLDNCAKSILDGLNKVAFNDDSQIVKLIVAKKYSEMPYVEVSIKSLEERAINET